MNALTPGQVVARIAVIIALVELAIMVAFHRVSRFEPTIEAILDPALLIVIATPMIYAWTIKPFVVARDQVVSEITQMANTDPLTLLANRRELTTRLASSLVGHTQDASYGALILIDLDGFKAVNDKRGHDAGDAVLLEVARRLKSMSRSDDVVSRLGGDEFVVLINRLDSDAGVARGKAARVAEKLQASLIEPILFHGEQLAVGASIGVRLFGTEALDVDTAIRDADVAMYRAKQAGRGGIVFF
jgi:two-component system, cell cycle response regulator